MKRDDLVGLLLIVGTLLYVGAHVARVLLRLLLPAAINAMPR